MSFLNAEWRKLAIANYEIDPIVLAPYIPPQTELDYWNNTCYVSLVGFMFVNTRLLGVSVPYHKHFEEVNLRFYVRFKDGLNWKRGVVFIKEIVPKPALTFVANTIYKEHYETMPMSHLWEDNEMHRIVQYGWQSKNHENSIWVKASREKVAIEKGTETEFITEHYWGYTKAGEDTSFEYEVTHPRWDCYPVEEYRIDVDFEEVYGSRFSMLDRCTPKSVILAEGSEITVENKRKLE